MRALATASMLFLSSLAGEVRAQPNDAAMTEEARQLYREGSKAANAGQWEKCRAKLLLAWGVKQHWQVAAQLGDCELRLGTDRDAANAAEHLSFAVQTAPASAAAAKRLAQDALEQAKKKVATIRVTANVAEADVRVDDKESGKAPLELFMVPGAHVVAARHDGYEIASSTITVSAGESRDVALELKIMASPAASASVAPVATNRNTGSPTPTSKPIEPDGFASAKPWLIGGSIVLATGGLVFGIVETAAANSKSDDASKQLEKITSTGQTCPAASSCAKLKATLESGSSAANMAMAGYAVAGAGAVAAIVLLVVPSGSHATSTGRVTPVVTHNHQGFELVGVF